MVIATHNPGKLVEIRELLDPYGVLSLSAAELGLPEPEETEADFVGNAEIKARAASAAAHLPALADDSGFCVASLGGEPGILSARWAGPNKDFGMAMQRIHQLTDGLPDPRAWFVCALSLAWPDGRTQSWLGRVDGVHVWPPRGSSGFGYDPIFVPDGATLTYGEMVHAAKEADSHRARAFTAMRAAVLD